MVETPVSAFSAVILFSSIWSERFCRFGTWSLCFLLSATAARALEKRNVSQSHFAEHELPIGPIVPLNSRLDSSTTNKDSSAIGLSRAEHPPAPLWLTNDSSHYYYDPCPLRTGENVVNLGLSISILPEAIVEQEVPAPAIDFQFKHGLSPSFSFYSALSTNYFTNVLTAGLQWNTGNDALSFAICSGLDGFAGSFDLGGEFDKTTAAALAYIPIIEIGHRFEKVALSLHVAASYVLYAQTRISSLNEKGLQNRVNDIYATLTFEQPFYGTTRIATGISVTYSRTPYQIWMLFDSFDEFVIVPEFFFSFQL